MDIARSDIAEKLEFSRILLAWHMQNRVSFPWRETNDPYKIVITELLLRKTSRSQVSKVYSKFFKKFPVVSVLAKARLRSIRQATKSLGMQNQRAMLLKNLAREIMKSGGNVPKRRDRLLALPGVGRYSA